MRFLPQDEMTTVPNLSGQAPVKSRQKNYVTPPPRTSSFAVAASYLDPEPFAEPESVDSNPPFPFAIPASYLLPTSQVSPFTASSAVRYCQSCGTPHLTTAYYCQRCNATFGPYGQILLQKPQTHSGRIATQWLLTGASWYWISQGYLHLGYLLDLVAILIAISLVNGKTGTDRANGWVKVGLTIALMALAATHTIGRYF